MGGTKKPTISKLKKTASRRGGKEKKDERKRVIYKAHLPKEEVDKLMKYIEKQRYVTPFLLSRRAEIRLSLARQILRDLAEKGIIKLEGKNRELEVYTHS